MNSRNPPKVYLDSLEARMERSEEQVRQLRAELADIYYANTTSGALNKPPKHSLNSSDEPEKTTSTERFDGLNASLYIMRRVLGIMRSPPPPHADDLIHLKVAESFTKMSVTPRRMHPFVGKSSGAVLVKAAIDLKADIKREEREKALGHSNKPPFDNQSTVENGEPEGEAGTWTSRRLQYWTWRPLKDLSRRTSPFEFPPKPLMTELIDLYFTRQNIYMPVLHRPTFERGIMENLHLRDDGFAATVLLVCATGSRWSLDMSMAEKGLACGWGVVSQVGYPLFRQADLYDLQYYCDIGVHRRKAHIEVPSVERELFKRAFWVLMCQDRIMSAGKGRTCALHHEDFDIDQPLEVDDEYWEHPTRPFQQPAGKPSQIAYFNAIIHLTHILSLSLKTLYSLNKMPTLFSSCKDWDEHAVPELDSALNDWHEKIPDHLRWNPARQDPLFFDQSVALHGWYYNTQILIHRPLIPMVRKSTPMGLPSLASCTNAARACANILHCQKQRTGNVPIVVNLSAAFTSALVLLLNVWSGKRTGLLPDPGREMANVYKCMEVIRLCEGRWQIAGIIWDILAELASAREVKLPNCFSSDTPSTGSEHPEREPNSSTNEPASHRFLPEAQIHMSHAPESQLSPFAADGLDTFGDGAMDPSVFLPTPPLDPWLPPEHMYTNPKGAGLEDMMTNAIDSDTIAMWTNAPRGLEVDDWGEYFLNLSEITQADLGLNGHDTSHNPTQ
ncbi:Zn(2)-C6 fungal-type domain-containing protein [Mycena sanguinolenta]|uniref:Zn(2)-C6 fungal-type domain-containing protein n=1 Tax=Mycena sanguinolenta TaxID=230812 RepID=A0A8H7DK99_9AGAR|nr:Zn(2)-C6 fungal-type domain-containing protein [Mycena sanguinolenta]